MTGKAIEIFGRHTSYNVQKVLWLADELGLDYSHIQTGGRFAGNDTPAFLAMNPTGKVPVLRIGNKSVWESNTIMRYLAGCYSSGKWISQEPYQRSLCERWMDWSIDRLEPAFVGVFWGYYRTPPDKRDNAAIESSLLDCERCLVLLGNQLDTNQFLIGGHPTLADIATGVFLYRLRSIDLEVSMPANVNAWYNRLTQRPGYRNWVMSDFSELQGRPDY